MHWTQTLYLLLLLIGSGAAITKDRWLLATVMWMNFAGTFALAEAPMAVGIWDIACASVLVWFGSKRERVVAALFVAMVVLYKFDEQLGRATLYAIVDFIAYAQIAVIGGGGFGELLRNVRSSLRNMHRPNPGHFVGSGPDAARSHQRDMGGDKKRGVSE